MTYKINLNEDEFELLQLMLDDSKMYLKLLIQQMELAKTTNNNLYKHYQQCLIEYEEFQTKFNHQLGIY